MTTSGHTDGERFYIPSSDPLIGWESYDDVHRDGEERSTRWLRIGRGRWRFEVGPWACPLVLGRVVVAIGVEWGDLDESSVPR